MCSPPFQNKRRERRQIDGSTLTNIWFNFLVSRSLAAYAWRIRNVLNHTPRSHVDVVIVENWKEKRCAVSTAMTSCCDLMYISVFVRLYCFSHTHIHTHTLSLLRFALFSVAMGSQACDLLDATMNIDAIDWKSAEEIKGQPPPHQSPLPRTVFMCAVMSTSWGRKQFKLQRKLNKNSERERRNEKVVPWRPNRFKFRSLALDMHKIWHYRKFTPPPPPPLGRAGCESFACPISKHSNSNKSLTRPFWKLSPSIAYL